MPRVFSIEIRYSLRFPGVKKCPVFFCELRILQLRICPKSRNSLAAALCAILSAWNIRGGTCYPRCLKVSERGAYGLWGATRARGYLCRHLPGRLIPPRQAVAAPWARQLPPGEQ